MKLISLNIELNKHHDTVLPFLKKENPDVICLQELLEEDFNRYKKGLNMEGTFKAFGYVKWEGYENIRGKKHGVAIFSKSINDSGFIFYEGREDNLLKSFEEYLSKESNHKNRVLVWADIKNKTGEVFKFLVTHLPVTKKGESSTYQLQVAGSLIKTLGSFEEFILCGDMNAPRGKETFSLLSKKYKDNIPLKYKTSIDQNLHRAKGIILMVDGLFTTPTYLASDVRLVDGVSDHMAVLANIEKTK